MRNNQVFKVTDMFDTLDVILECQQKTAFENIAEFIQKTVSNTLVSCKELVEEFRKEKDMTNQIAERLLYVKLHDFLMKCYNLLKMNDKNGSRIQHIESLIQEVISLSQMPHLKLGGHS